MRVLLVEDDTAIAEIVHQALTHQRYLVDTATDGQTGWELAAAFVYDLIVLDVMLPRLDGVHFCQRLRHKDRSSQPLLNGYTPVLLIKSRAASTDKVAALDAGADDYLVKPFDLNELLARVRALLRRGDSARSPLLTWGPVQLDPDRCEATVAERSLHLSAKEYSFLELMLRSPKRIFSYSYLIEHLWAPEEVPTENAVRAQIKGLRKKLKEAGAGEFIETVYGLGYRLRECQEPDLVVREDATATVSLAPAVAEKAVSPDLFQTVAHDLFAKHQASYCVRLAVIEAAVVALRQQKLSEALRFQACQEAHTLKGSLGLFEMDEASHQARNIEHLLQAQPTGKHVSQLEHLVQALKQMLTSDRSSAAEQDAQTAPPCPTQKLWILGDNPAVIGELVQAASLHPLRVEVMPPENGCLDRAHSSCPDAVLLILGRVMESESWANWREWVAQHPQVPFFVIAASTEPSTASSFQQRLQVAQLGAKGFWQGIIDPQSVLQTVVKSVQRAPEAGAKLLIVDDDLAMLEAMQTILQPWEFELTRLNNPQQFWDTLEQIQPDLVILDIEMPEISGIELCQVIRQDEQWSELPVLFLSAHTDNETLHKIFTVGADDYVSKPVRAVELVSRILRRLEQSRLLKQLRQFKQQ